MTVPCEFARVLVELTMPDGAVMTFTCERPEWAELDVSAPFPAVAGPGLFDFLDFGAPSPGRLSLLVRPAFARPMTSEARAGALPAVPSFAAADVPPGTVIRLREDPSAVAVRGREAFVAEKCEPDLWRLASWPGRHLWDSEVQAEVSRRGVDVLWPRFGDGR